MVPHCYGEARRHGKDTEKIRWTWEGYQREPVLYQGIRWTCAILKLYCSQI